MHAGTGVVEAVPAVATHSARVYLGVCAAFRTAHTCPSEGDCGMYRCDMASVVHRPRSPFAVGHVCSFETIANAMNLADQYICDGRTPHWFHPTALK